MKPVTAQTESPVLLDEIAIRTSLTPTAKALLQSLETHLELASTNTYLMSLAQQKKTLDRDQVIVCLAEQQSAGKGRRGRVWFSPFAANLYLSLLCCLHIEVAKLLTLSPFCAIQVARALQKIGLRDIQLKWPNDLLWQGQKLGGILLENSGQQPCQTVIGVGINVNMAQHRIAAAPIDQPWVDLQTALCSLIDRNQLAAFILNALLPSLQHFAQGQHEDLSNAWAEFDAFYGRSVILHTAEQKITGVAQGIDADGALKLLCNQRLLRFHIGELSLRAQPC